MGCYVRIEDVEQMLADNGILGQDAEDMLIGGGQAIDGLKTYLEEDIAGGMDAADLARALRNNSDVIAVQMWQRGDICAAMRAIEASEGRQLDMSSEAVDRIAMEARSVLENTTDNWDKLHEVIHMCQPKEEK